MKTSLRRLLLSFVLCPLSLLAGCGGGSGTADQTPPKAGAAPVENQLESAQQILATSPDRAACATALQQINSYLADKEGKRPPALSAGEKDLLANRYGLDDGELAEVESATYTLLDGAHVEFCLLLRDAVRSLGVDKLSPAEQAAAAFAWAMRHVPPAGESESLYPPEFVLRRGAGNDQERARVFLAVLHQMGIPGCLITTRNAAAPWACGALVEVEGAGQKQVLLFDHRFGLPLPGGSKGSARGQLARAFRLASPVLGATDGQQVATLAELREQPGLLKPLTIDAKHAYDVGPEQVSAAVVRLAPPLSALSSRMRALEDGLLPQPLGVRLGVDPAELIHQFGSAAGVEGGAEAVRAWPGAAGVLRRFLGEAEGGIDQQQQHQRARFTVVPKSALPPQLAELEGEIGDRVRADFNRQFITFQLEPHMPRDLVLRGQYKEATAQLTGSLFTLRVQQDRLNTDREVFEKLETWKHKLVQAYGEADRAQDEAHKAGAPQMAQDALARREQVWKEGYDVLRVLVDGSTAEPRAAQARFQLALCMHEQAQRLQTHADDLAYTDAPAADKEAARRSAEAAWEDAAGWWKTFLDHHPVTLAGIHARLLRARAQQGRHNPDQARALLLETPRGISPSQELARLYLARRL